MTGYEPDAQPTPKLTRKQRDAIREEVVWMLNSACEDFGMCLVQKEDFDDAQRLRQDFEDWSALLDDLGWAADDPRDSFEITLPWERLHRVLRRLREWAGTTMLSHALGSLKGLDEDGQTKRAVIIGEACGDIHLALPVEFMRRAYDCPRRCR